LTASDRRHKSDGAGENLWPDAEAFIDVLESAARQPKSASARHLIGILRLSGRDRPTTIEQLRDSARRLLAVECSTFLRNADVQTERWAPYRDWVKILNSTTVRHTIITFNYDRVLELLGLGAAVILPGQVAPDAGVTIFKLHGSVTWRLVDGKTLELTDDQDFAARCPDAELAIAPPGPSKADMVSGLLEPLWKKALERLTQAHRVVFLGYRFPPTDSIARSRLLGALQHREHVVHSHIVLGPKVTDDVARLEGLLRYACGASAGINIERMWAEDFLGLAPTIWK
jgi:hypothetical protein